MIAVILASILALCCGAFFLWLVAQVVLWPENRQTPKAERGMVERRENRKTLVRQRKGN